MEFGPEVLLLLFFVAILAGWVDSIAGGGGLLTFPALLMAGLPPATALATNKLQGTAGTLTSTLYFVRKKKVDLGKMTLPIAMTFAGSVFGSWLVLKIDSEKLIIVLPVFLILIGLYFLLSPDISDEDKKQRITLVGFALLVCPLLGFHDGFFGPGAGSFMALAFVMLLGYGLPRATAHSKLLNFISNISSLLYFMVFGEVHWLVGGAMIAGQFIGASVGARMVISKGTALIKPVVVSVCFLLSLNILYKSFF